MSVLAAGFAGTAQLQASSSLDLIGGPVIAMARSAGACASATEAGRIAVPRPRAARCATIGRALASNTTHGVKPSAAQAASRAVRTPVPGGKQISG
jgi:hypothetical protein